MTREDGLKEPVPRFAANGKGENMRGEQSAEQPVRVYYYHHCKGKYEDDGKGGRRSICEGHIFTLETRMSHCPVCGQPLEMLKGNKELPKAITCALEKCICCENRERSTAVNDEHCLGGDRFKDGKMEKVIGSRLCNGCLCAACCQGIIEDLNILKKHGMSAVVKAQAKLKDFARRVLLDGKTTENTEKMYIDIRGQDPVLRDIRQEICQRWGMDAFHIVKKELANEGGKNEGRN
jgi:hypothetical protein